MDCSTSDTATAPSPARARAGRLWLQHTHLRQRAHTDECASAGAVIHLARGSERAAVVLLHGWNDIRPTGYEPWIAHLNQQSVTAIYPHNQARLFSTPAQMLQGAKQSTCAGLIAAPPSGPVIATDYSLCGGFAAVYAVFPARPPSVPESFGTVPDATSVTLLAGDGDQVVGTRRRRRAGSRDLTTRSHDQPAGVDRDNCLRPLRTEAHRRRRPTRLLATARPDRRSRRSRLTRLHQIGRTMRLEPFYSDHKPSRTPCRYL